MKRLSLFFLLITVSLVLSSFLILNVNSDANYEWIQNPSFEQHINYFEDSGAESGILKSGVIYGNFSASYSYGDINNITSLSKPHGGTRSFKLAYSVDCNYGLKYTLLVPIMGSDISNCSFMGVTYTTGSFQVDIRIYYSDDTNTLSTYYYTFGESWTRLNILSLINVAKYVSAIEVISGAVHGESGYCDDFVLYVSSGYAQSEITQSSYPWFMPYGGDVSFNSTYHHNLDYSVHANINLIPSSFWNGLSYPPIVQSVSGLSSSYITGFNLWAINIEYPYSETVSVRGYVWFSDNSYATKSISFATNNTWQFFNFYSLITDNPSKTVISIGFVQETNGYRGYVFFDEISLTATIQYNSGIFTFTLSPSPISYTMGSTSGYGFIAYANFNYVFNGFLNDNTNGTFNVNSNYAVTNGIITNGLFTFVISSRTDRGLTAEFQEQFLIQVNDGITIRIYSVLGLWEIQSSGTTPTPTPTSTTMQTQFISYFPILIVFALFTIPATYWLGMAGFLGGIDLSFLFCTWFGLVPTWGLAILVLINVVLLYFKIDSSRNHSSGEEP